MANKEISGIYKIINLINEKIYVGSTINLKDRVFEHFYTLRKNEHCNKYLQRSFNKYGEENFKFEIIEYCERENLIEREQYYIDLYKACELGYNICPNAGSRRDIPLSKEHKKKIGLANKGRKYSEKYRKEMSLRNIGKKHSEKTKNKMSLSHKGKTFTKNHRKNISKGRKGIIFSEDTKKKISSAHKGKKLSEEHKKNVSIAIKKWWNDRKNENIVLH